MSALSDLLLDDREEEQGAACDLSASADTQAPEAEQAAKGASPSPQVSKEEQEKTTSGRTRSQRSCTQSGI